MPGLTTTVLYKIICKCKKYLLLSTSKHDDVPQEKCQRNPAPDHPNSANVFCCKTIWWRAYFVCSMLSLSCDITLDVA